MDTELHSWATFKEQIKHDDRICNFLHGKTKQQIKNAFGLQGNDMSKDVWSYRIGHKVSIFSPNYLFIQFDDNEVVNYRLKKN